MEKTNSLPKQKATDGQGAFAGNLEPTPDRDTISSLAKAVGVEIPAGEPVRTKSVLDERDDNRWELDPDSAQQ